MFNTIPHGKAKKQGAIQEGTLDELTSKTSSADEVDLGSTDWLIAERLGTR